MAVVAEVWRCDPRIDRLLEQGSLSAALEYLFQRTQVFEQCPEPPSCFATEIRFDISAAHEQEMWVVG